MLLIAAGAYLPWTWSGELGSLGGDGAIYVLTARSLSSDPPQGAVADRFAADSQFPPLYPWLLAASGAAHDLHHAHALTTLFLLGALAAALALLRAWGLTSGLALATVALFAASPGTFLQALQLHSESLYLLASLLALLMLARADRSPCEMRWWWLAAAAIAAATLARTVGLALVPALLAMLYRHRPRRAWGLAVAAVVPALGWAAVHRPELPYHEGLIASYATLAPEAVAGKLFENARALLTGFGMNLVQSDALFWLTGPLGLLAGVIGLCRLRAGQPDAWYAASYAAVIIAWPYPAQATRFAWPLLPIAMGYLVWGGTVAARLLEPSTRTAVAAATRWLAPSLLALMLVPGFALALQRRFDPAADDPRLVRLPEWYMGLDARFHLETVAAISHLGRQVPEGACVYSVVPALVALYADRDGRGPPRESAGPAALEAFLDSGACRYFLVLALGGGATYPSGFYPLERMGHRLRPIAAWPPDREPTAVLMEVRPRAGGEAP